jgi:hypothetical protein
VEAAAEVGLDLDQAAVLVVASDQSSVVQALEVA